MLKEKKEVVSYLKARCGSIFIVINWYYETLKN